MTKKQLEKYFAEEGCQTAYSGKAKTMYIKGPVVQSWVDRLNLPTSIKLIVQ